MAGINFLTAAGDNADDVLECGYQTGNVSVRLYQDRGDPYSVGGALVLKGNLVDLFVDTSACFIGRKVTEALGLVRARLDPPLDPPAVICDATPQTLRSGRPYTVVSFSSSQSLVVVPAGTEDLRQHETVDHVVTGYVSKLLLDTDDDLAGGCTAG